MPEEFNSVDANIPAVKEHVEANPDSATAILEAEKARGDDARGSLVEWLQKRLTPVVPEEPTEEKGDLVTRTFHGKEYVQSPEGGFRLKG